ncbi:MAG: hypothetical protein NW215_07370 [Hyphomicrobiales bacterium]|nr:hypothetical protein [Hyphomicrobiales bacterium]
MKSRVITLVGFLVLSSVNAIAGDGHDHAKAENGGQIEKIGSYEGELVVKGGELALFVRDEKDKVVDVASMSAVAVVLVKGNEQKTVELKPAGANKMTGMIDFPVDGKLRATVSLKAGAVSLGKARYTLDVK